MRSGTLSRIFSQTGIFRGRFSIYHKCRLASMVLRVNKKTGARSARARMRGQNPLVLYTLLSKDIDQEFQKNARSPRK